MKKNILFLKNTTLDFVPEFDYHMNEYSWSLLKEVLGVESWDEVVKVESYIIDECPDYPLILPISEFEDIDNSVKQFKSSLGKIWGVDCVSISHLESENNYSDIYYIRILDLELW